MNGKRKLSIRIGGKERRVEKQAKEEMKRPTRRENQNGGQKGNKETEMIKNEKRRNEKRKE